MKPFTYVVPKSLDEAKEAAAQPDAIVKGAGLDIVDRMKERLQTPQSIVNLLPLKSELAGIATEENGDVRRSSRALTDGRWPCFGCAAGHRTSKPQATRWKRSSSRRSSRPRVRRRVPRRNGARGWRWRSARPSGSR
mgnify:CR=1 FL=1